MTDLEKKLYDVLDLIMAEIKSDPISVAKFDSRLVLQASKLVDDYKAARRDGS